jgi:hypothetical protein
MSDPISTIVWRPIKTAPIGRPIFVADLIDCISYLGMAHTDSVLGVVFVCPGIPSTPASHWTHWADMPELPEWKDQAND